MTSTEEELLQTLVRAFQMLRQISARLLRKRTPDLSRRMQDARGAGDEGLLAALREQEFRSLVENMQNERNHNPEFANEVDRLPDDERTQRVEAEAHWQQDQRNRMDTDPNLTPEHIQREVDARHDRDGNGLYDEVDQDRAAEDFETGVVDRNLDGGVDAVQQRQEAQAARDAEQARKQEQERSAEARETAEARGGDVLPAAAAAGAGAVVAEEVFEELEERQDRDALDAPQTEALNNDGTTREVIGETDAERDARQSQLGSDDGAVAEVIGETDADVADRQGRDGLDAQQGEQSQVLNDDGTAREVIGETDAEVADRQGRDGLDAQQGEQSQVLNDDGTAREVIGETDAERDDRLAEPEPAQDDRLLDKDDAAPRVIGEDPQQPNLDQNGQNQNGQNQNGLDQDAPNQDGLDQDGPDQDGLDQDGLDQDGPDQDALDQDALDQDGPEQNGPEQDALDRDALDQDPLDQDGLNQNGPGQDGPGVDGSGPEGQQRGAGQVEQGEAGPAPELPTGGDQAAASRAEDQTTQRRPDPVDRALQNAREENGQGGPGTQNGQNGQRQIPQDELDRLRGMQDGQPDASRAPQTEVGESTGADVGGKNPGTRAAELRSGKAAQRNSNSPSRSIGE